jgi:transposase
MNFVSSMRENRHKATSPIARPKGYVAIADFGSTATDAVLEDVGRREYSNAGRSNGPKKVRQGIGFLRMELPTILATRTDALSPRMLRVIEELAGDWRRLDQRIDGLSGEIEALARQDQACSRLMTVPGIGPIISSAMVAAIGTRDVFSKGRDFGARLGLVPKQTSTGDRTILGKSPGGAIATWAFCSCRRHGLCW